MHVDRRTTLLGMAALAAVPMAASGQATAEADVVIDPTAPLGSISPVWKAAGSDRASTALRAQWQEDLRRVRQAADIRTIRFHGLFDDEMDVFRSPLVGQAMPNFQLIDEVYDRMLDAGVRPYVELSFMPSALASGRDSVMSYRGNVTPPRDFGEWRSFIADFGRHIVSRYGLAEVSTWNFEVWNEPNLGPFWTGGQAAYFDLYEHAALGLKSVSSELKVGGPATAQTAWIEAFLDHCATRRLPLDFVTTHCYPKDPQEALFGPGAKVPIEWVIPRGVEHVRSQIDRSRFSGLPLHLTEWSSESPAFIAHTVTHCLPSLQSMSYWTFSGVFEELGVARTPFGDGNFTFGMTALRGIPKPSLHAFALLNRLHGERVRSTGPSLATRDNQGAVAALVWNLGASDAPSGIPGVTRSEQATAQQKTLSIRVMGAARPIRLTRIDMDRGSARSAWEAMGKPAYPTSAQLATLRDAATMPAAETLSSDAQGRLSVSLASDGLALLEIPA